MAQLKIDIIVDDNGAAAKLGQVENAVKGVESSAAKSSGAFANASKSFSNGVSAMASSASNFVKIAGAMYGGILFDRGISALANLSKEMFRNAGALTDLSAKSGLTIVTLQKLEFVGLQAGVSIEKFADAAFMVGVRLGQGSKGVVGAVKDLGLNFEALKAMNPDQQMNLILSSLSKVGTEQERNRIGVELFGRSFKGISAAVVSGYDDMANAAHTAGDEQIKALDNASDAWDRFVQNRKADLTSLLGSVVMSGQNRGILGVLANIGARAAGMGAVVPMLEMGTEGDGLTQQQRDFDAAFNKKAAEQAAAALGVDSPTSSRTSTRTSTRSAPVDSWTMPGVNNEGALFQQESFQQWLSRTAMPGNLGMPFVPATQGLGGQSFGTSVGGFGMPGMDALAAAGPSFLQSAFGSSKDIGTMIGDAFVDAVRSSRGLFDTFKALGTNLLSSIGSGLGSVLGGMASKGIGGALGGILGSVLPGLGSMLGPLVSGLLGKVFGPTAYETRTRDEAQQRAEIQSTTDFAALKQQAEAAGRMDLFTGITSGLATNNDPKYILSLITQLQGAWEKSNAAMAASGEATALAAEKANAAITAFDNQIKSLQQSIANEAPEEVMGVLEAQTRAQIAVLEEQRAAAQADAKSQSDAFLADMDGKEIHVKVIYDHVNPPSGFAPSKEAPEFDEVPEFARGGYVPARRGGTLIRVGEAGQGEYITPENKMGGSGISVTVNVTGTVTSERDLGDALMEIIATRVREQGLMRV
jgi:hypothetical protein